MTFHIACCPCLLQLIAGFPESAGSVRKMDRASAFAERCEFIFNQFEDVHGGACPIEPKLNRHPGLKFRNTPGGKAGEVVRGSRMHLVQLLLPVADNAGQRIPASLYEDVANELTERFGGVIAYTRSPAEGRWQSGTSEHHDDVL